MTSVGPLLVTFFFYFMVMLFVGLKAYRNTVNLDDYILGGRKLHPLLVALSVGASDMSGWLLLGLPGAIYLSGLSEIWIGVGLFFGAYCNWRFISKRLRVYSETANNSLTLPDFFENRFNDSTRSLRIISATVILLFFTFYTASGLVGGAILFESSFGFSYITALIIGAFFIVAYTFIGGFIAVVWTDAIQSLLMLLALIAVPVAVVSSTGGGSEFIHQVELVKPGAMNAFSNLSLAAFISLLGWGFGYFGQPHILTRFMSVKHPGKLLNAKRVAMLWMAIVLLGSVYSGLAGIVYFTDSPLSNPETVFIALNQSLFNPWIAGIITAAILSAIMSTVDSQLLVSSSVISEDFYRVFVRPDATDKELLLVSRLAVMVIAIVALFIASDREARVLDLVSYAWAGFGAAFGPVIIFSLFLRYMTGLAAMLGMLSGSVTVVVWANLTGGLFDLYEIVPGFIVGSIVVLGVSKANPQTSKSVLAQFDESMRIANRL